MAAISSCRELPKTGLRHNRPARSPRTDPGLSASRPRWRSGRRDKHRCGQPATAALSVCL